jgi:DNA polymerase-2
MVDELRGGRLDDLLVYRKRLRQPLEAYRRNVPPHVQAARKMQRPGRWVHYVMTLNGPEPAKQRSSPLDYQHYVERQLGPVADGILYFIGESFARFAANQMDLF